MSEVVEIIALRTARGASGGQTGDGPWRFTATFTHWRIDGGPIQTGGTLYVSKELPSSPGQAMLHQFPALSVMRLHVTIRPDEWQDGSVRAMLVENFGSVADTELDSIAEDLKTPVVQSIEGLGDFTLIRRHGWFERSVEWMGQPVSMTMHAQSDDTLNSADASIATGLVAGQQSWDERMRDYAAEELLELKNDNWLGEDEQAITKAQFVERLAPESINIEPDGEFSVFYGDGEMFFGHVIIVQCSFHDGPKSAQIAG